MKHFLMLNVINEARCRILCAVNKRLLGETNRTLSSFCGFLLRVSHASGLLVNGNQRKNSSQQEGIPNLSDNMLANKGPPIAQWSF